MNPFSAMRRDFLSFPHFNYFYTFASWKYSISLCPPTGLN